MMIDLKKCETCFHKYHTKYEEWFCEHFLECEMNDHYKPYTNGDMIRQMDDEQLAKFLCNFEFCVRDGEPCVAEKYCHMGHVGFLDWVKEAVKIDW